MTNFFHRRRRAFVAGRSGGFALYTLTLVISIVAATTGATPAAAQDPQNPSSVAARDTAAEEVVLVGGGKPTSVSTPPLVNGEAAAGTLPPRLPGPAAALYSDPLQGASSSDLVRRSLASNAEIAAARIDVQRARARVLQAGLRPNPTLDFEQTTGRLTGSRGESVTSVGFALPIELGGKRRRRLELAQAELEAAEADVANRERVLAAEVRTLYAEALAALRELETTENLNQLDVQTARVVQVRVSEGDTAPIELSQLRVEVERLRARRALVEGRVRAAIIRLKSLTGTPPGENLRLREDLASPALPAPSQTLEAAIEIALRTRPDLRLARLNEEVAQAGLRLARAQRTPDIVPFTRYAQSRAAFDRTPVGVITDRDRTLSFGVSVGIPVFNRNQGAQAEASAAITQAQRRREFAEAVVRSEVTAAFTRYAAARTAVTTFDQGVVQRSNDNIRVIRAAYDLGQYRITDLINEQRRLVDSQREFTEALAEQYRSLADFQAAVGAPVEP